jgi:hypothetical protein
MRRKTRYWLVALALATLVVLGVWVSGNRFLMGTRMMIVGTLVFVIFVVWIVDATIDVVKRRVRSDTRKS